MKKRKDYSICVRCKNEKQTDVQLYCKLCRKDDYERRKLDRKDRRITKLDKQKNQDQLIEFVSKIERRNGLASLKDLCVELITFYYNFHDYTAGLDKMPPAKQLETMWIKIKKVKESIVEKRMKKIKSKNKTIFNS